MLTVGKPSLVQQKKQQWAREREEMSHLYSPWGTGGGRYTDRLQVRNQFASSIDLHNHSYEYQEPPQRQRSPSLPPIRNSSETTVIKEDPRTKDTLNRNLSSAKRFTFYDEDGEGDTSGYGSETINLSIRKNGSRGESNPVVAWQQDDNRSKVINEDVSNTECQWTSRSPRSISAEEGRPRWGDRGVATGRLWEPTAANDRLPQMTNEKRGTPSWVERGLNMIENTAEVLVIDQSSSTSALDCDRSSYNGSDEGRSFLRGQNVPLEPEIKAQRENKRIKALELQSAILSQLEEQEKRKREDRERKLKEEKLEELHILKQQQEDRLKYEEEKRKLQEKQLLEHKKLEILKKALEDAELKAKQEKEKRFNKCKYNIHKDQKTEKTQPQSTRSVDPVLNGRSANSQKEICKESIEKSNKNITNRSYEPQPNSPLINNQSSRQTTEFNSPRSVGTGSFYVQNIPPLSLSDNQYSILPIGISEDIINNKQNGLQLAVLVPQNLSSSLYNLSLNSLNVTETIDNSAKTLTPRKFRNYKYRDASTQTDSSFIKSTVDKANETENNGPILTKEYQKIDENAPLESNHSTLKKDRRLRIEERYKKDLENRPKWGVNRPVAQYKKQSEKDPFYSQKRKIRQKHRPQHRQYLSQSSDDSRSPSPPIRPEKLPVTYRNSMSQSYWRHKRSSQDLSMKLNNEVLNNGSHQSTINDIADSKKSPTNNEKRMTLSQKFINDKYGNRKLWNEEIVTDRNIKSHSLDVENRKKIIEQLNIAKKEYFERLENENNTQLLN